MTAPVRGQAREQHRVHSANDQFKARWDECVAWSMMAAVALHAVVFALSPSWPMWRAPREPPLELVQLGPTPGVEAGSSLAGAPTAAVPAAGNPTSDPVERDPEGNLERTEGEIATPWELLRRRLLGEGAPVPTIAEPEPESASDAPTPAEEDPIAVRGAASAADYPGSLGPGALDLERLSSVRPELALVPPDVWVVLRNSPEVTGFMRRVYAQGLDPRASGTVSVALWIDDTGSVEWAEIAESSGRSDLDEVALALFNEIVDFRPARERGVPVPTTAIFSITFPWF